MKPLNEHTLILLNGNDNKKFAKCEHIDNINYSNPHTCPTNVVRAGICHCVSTASKEVAPIKFELNLEKDSCICSVKRVLHLSSKMKE